MGGTASGVKRKNQLWEEERWRGTAANRKVFINSMLCPKVIMFENR